MPVRTTRRVGQHQRRERARPFADDRRREDRPDLAAGHELHRFLAKRRCEVDQIVDRHALTVVRRRLGDERLRRRVPLARHVALFHRTLFDRPHRFAGDAIEHVDPPLLGGLADGLDGAAVHGEVHQNRRARDVHVPDAVVHELEVPFPLAGFQIERDEALAEEAAARPVAAVIVAGRQLHRQEHHAELFVDSHLRPHARVARVGPGVFFPRVVAELARERNRVENPQPLAGARVVAADESFFVNPALGCTARQVGGADDDDVFRDDRRGVQAHLSGDDVDRLVVVLLEIDDAVFAEAGRGEAGLGVEGDHLITRRDVDDAGAAAVSPVREAAP